MAIPYAPGCTSLIVSAERPELSDFQNLRRTLELGASLVEYGLDFAEAEGRQQGRPTRSYIVGVDSPSLGHEFDAVLELAREYDQESVLLVLDDGSAVLLNVHDDSSKTIGQCWEESEKEVGDGDYAFVDGALIAVHAPRKN